MKIIVKHPGKNPYIEEVEDDLKTYQNIVGGYIEIVHIDGDILLICNEEGKIEGLPYNFYWGDDIIVGTVFFVGRDMEDFRGLTDDEAEQIMGWF